MNNPTIQLQITCCKVTYYKIRHINPVLVEVDMEFYHSLPTVQKVLKEMIRLESVAMSLKASNITSATTTMTTTPTPTIKADNNVTPATRDQRLEN